MKKMFIKFICLSIIIYTIIYFHSIITLDYMRNTYMDINEYYSFSDFGTKSDSNSIFLQIVKKTPSNTCFIVKRLSNYEGEYIIGEAGIEEYAYLDCEKYLKYTGYFYISYDNKEDAKFNLTEEEIKKKFPKKIKYLRAKKFLNIYGAGNLGDSKSDVPLGAFLWTMKIMFYIMIIVFLVCSWRRKE